MDFGTLGALRVHIGRCLVSLPLVTLGCTPEVMAEHRARIYPLERF